jgi:histidinol-phosphate aminotransferase
MSVALALARPELAALPAYRRGDDAALRARLDANEVPWRPAGDRSRPGLNRYPPVRAIALEARWAERLGVAPESMLATRGSDEAIDLLVRAFCRPERDAILVLPPTFAMYALAARIQGAGVIEVRRRRAEGFALDLAAIERRLASVKLLFVPSPDNPTGRLVRADELEALAALTAGRALLVVDEAYAEFAGGESAVRRLSEWPHLVVLRTLSKAHALAGARCGAAVASAELVDLLARILPPFPLGARSIEAALAQLAPAALETTARRVAALVASRERLARRLAALPEVRRVFPSAANFLLVAFADRAAAQAALERRGVATRAYVEPQLADCLRITVGSAADNRAVVGALAELA